MENYLIANCSDTGRVRSVNEDSMTTFDSPNGRVVVVCDGMGGQNAGDVASQLAVAVIQDILTDNKFDTPEEAITKSIMAANQAILLRSAQNEELSGMGATCVMLIIEDNKVYYGSVGDSRIYYITRAGIRQITKDQSYVQTLVDAGEISQEAAEHHKDKNQITNALGLQGMTPPVVCQMPITPEPDSVFLLCSDGLSGMINNNMMQKVASNNAKSLADRANELISLANEAGGIDNITVQLVEFPKNAFLGSPSASAAASKGKKTKKNHATAYWIASIICILAVIGCVTYWIINMSDKTKQIDPIKVETKAKESKPAPQKATAPSQQATETQVVIVEKETPSKAPKAKNPKKNKTKEIITQGQEKLEGKGETGKAEELSKEIKTTDNSSEKD